MDFKSKHPFQARAEEARKIREKFPGRIPVIVEKGRRAAADVPDVDKNKFLVPADLTLGQFIYVIRKRLVMPPEKALFIFIGNTLPASGTFMRELYAYHADQDGFLYVEYSGESTFGSAGT